MSTISYIVVGGHIYTMYIARIKLNQSSCSLAYATEDGNLTMNIVEYILLNDRDAVFLCRIDEYSGDLKEYFKKMEEHKSTRFLQILEKTPTNIDFIAVVRDTTGIKAFEDSYCFVKPPIKVTNGNKYYTVYAPDIRYLKNAYEKLKSIGKWEVIEIKSSDQSKQLLTQSQNRVLKIAYELGYFSRNRNINLEQIADVLGISKSTVHKHIREAVNRVIEDYIERYVKIPETFA
jgi:hypothetical protein